MVDPKMKAEGKKDARYDCMKSILTKVNPLAQGYTCAVLVNKNSEVASVVEYLRRELPHIPVASESERMVSDGPIGAVFLDLFRWLANPGHDFGQIHLAMSPLHEVIVGLTDTDEPAAQWQRLTERIASFGVEPLVNTLISQLRAVDGVSLSAYGESRVDAIHAAAISFSAKGGSLSDWVDVLEAKKQSETTREGMIQVMTVHRCKGLGFDVVILPELHNHNSFSNSSRLDAIERKGELGAVEYVLKKPKAEICRADPATREMLEAWEADQCYESFCKLYVALTRAVHATYCIVDPVKDNWECTDRYDAWIREATAKHGEAEISIGEESYTALYESGTWLEIDDEKAADSADKDDASDMAAPVRLQQAAPRMGRKVASVADDYLPGLLMQQGHGEGARFGTEVHELFEKVTWLDDLEGGEDGSLGDSKAAELIKSCLATESIREHFVRPQLAEGQYRLLCEQPFETQQEGRWISGVIDRAVILYEGGQPSEVKIIDYKTDSSDEGMSAASLREKYTNQLGLYRQAMAQITGLAGDKVSCFILSTALKEMVEL